MSDITEHPQFGDLKRLLRKLEKTDATQSEPLSSLVRQTAPTRSPPPLPDVALAPRRPAPAVDLDESLKIVNPPDLPRVADGRSLAASPGRPSAVSGSGAGSRITVRLVMAVAMAGLTGAAVWAVRQPGLADWIPFRATAQDRPVQVVDKDTSQPERANGERLPPSSPPPAAALPEANISDPPNPGPRAEGPPPDTASRAATHPADPDTAKPAAAPVASAARVAEGRTDAPLLGGRDKYELEARLDAYLEHGQKLLDEGDVTGARSFFSRVADSGDPRGAEVMGLTYDPNYIVSIGIRGLQPDLEAASRWYRRAMDLGSKDAMDRLDRLGERPK